jgi:acetone carboxylase gamma subunit
MSLSWAALVRKLMIANQVDIITELEHTIRMNYPANDHDRVLKVIQVIQNKAVWTPLKLTAELPAITVLTEALGGPETEDQLLLALQK